MRKLILFVLIISCIIGYFQLKPKMYRYVMNDPQSEIILYGKEGCSVCNYLRTGLSENKIAYTFKDVIKNADAKEELINRIRPMNVNGQSVPLPVVVVNNEVLFYYDFPRLMRERASKQFILFK